MRRLSCNPAIRAFGDDLYQRFQRAIGMIIVRCDVGKFRLRSIIPDPPHSPPPSSPRTLRQAQESLVPGPTAQQLGTRVGARWTPEQARGDGGGMMAANARIRCSSATGPFPTPAAALMQKSKKFCIKVGYFGLIHLRCKTCWLDR